MIITIHQPQYLPWLPYFEKIFYSDIFVILDHVQFEKNHVQNRNQILGSNGPFWLTLPVKHKFGQSILKTEIANNKSFKKHLKTIENTYKRAPFFNEAIKIFDDVDSNSKYLIDIVNPILKSLLRIFQYKGAIYYSSEMSIQSSASDMIFEICRKTKATEYYSGGMGKDYLKLNNFNEKNIKVSFQEYIFKEYNQFNSKKFVSKMSILDLIMNYGFGSETLNIIRSNS